jgi:putative ABC transport system ATP-binding protein
VALLGRSGSGKSTLLNIISGIDKADAGSVTVDGIDLTALSEHECTLFRRRHIGFVYQFFNLIPTLTVAENIALVLELNDNSPRQVAAVTDQMIRAVDLDRQRHMFPDQLSGGEQQRVAIARALVHVPKLVLADELTGNLDAEVGRKIIRLLKELIIETRGTLLLVTHSLAVAKTADRIVTLEDGLLLEREGHFAW